MQKPKERAVALVLAAATAAPGAYAENSWEVSAKAATLGLGIELRRGFGTDFAVRGLLNSFTYAIDEEYSDVAYDGDLELRSGGAFLDFHPGGGRFRLTGGFLLNGNTLDLDGEPTGGSYEFNGIEYDATQIASASGKARFNDFAPYFGIGIGSAPDGARGFSFSADLGVLFQGATSFDLTVNCAAAVPAPVCTQIQADAEAERRQFENDADEYEFFPVLSLGVGYRF